MSFIQSAFDAVIKDAVKPTGHYVVLLEQVQRYGGPEEGGWWTTDTEVVSYKEFPTLEQAEAAAEAVKKLAKELSEESRKSLYRTLAESVEWLEARGLDADFLPEPDGPTTYYVSVTDSIPEPSYGPTHYE